jgi:hypothetical protein
VVAPFGMRFARQRVNKGDREGGSFLTLHATRSDIVAVLTDNHQAVRTIPMFLIIFVDQVVPVIAQSTLLTDCTAR